MLNWINDKIADWYAPKELHQIVAQFDKHIGHLEEYESRTANLAAGKQDAIAALHEDVVSHLENLERASVIKENLKKLIGR